MRTRPVDARGQVTAEYAVGVLAVVGVITIWWRLMETPQMRALMELLAHFVASLIPGMVWP